MEPQKPEIETCPKCGRNLEPFHQIGNESYRILKLCPVCKKGCVGIDADRDTPGNRCTFHFNCCNCQLDYCKYHREVEGSRLEGSMASVIAGCVTLINNPKVVVE